MKYNLDVELPGLPKLPNAASRGWRGRYGESQKWLQKMSFLIPVRKRPKAPLKLATLTFTRISAQEPDNDNLCASFKLVQDCLKKLRIIEDDSPQHVICYYKWERGRLKNGCIRIKVEEHA